MYRDLCKRVEMSSSVTKFFLGFFDFSPILVMAKPQIERECCVREGKGGFSREIVGGPGKGGVVRETKSTVDDDVSERTELKRKVKDS